MSVLFRDHVMAATQSETLGTVLTATLTLAEAEEAECVAGFAISPESSLGGRPATTREHTLPLDLGPLGTRPVLVRLPGRDYRDGVLLNDPGESLSLQPTDPDLAGCRCVVSRVAGGTARIVAACTEALRVDRPSSSTRPWPTCSTNTRRPTVAKTAHFEEAADALRGQAFSVYVDDDTAFAGWWPMHRPVPMVLGIRDGRVSLEFTGQREVFAGIACAEFRATDEAAGEVPDTHYRDGTEDFFDTHEQDDLRDFGDEEAFQDMREELDD